MSVKVSALAEGAEDPRYMTSLARGLGVLRAFEGKPSLTVSQAAAATGLSRSSAARCLYTLERLGYVAADGPSYRLRAALLPLVRAYTYSDPLAMAAPAVVSAIRERLGESSSLGVSEPSAREAVIYVCRAETSHIISTPLLIGSTLPSYCTSMGRVLLAALPEAEARAALAATELRVRTPKTIVDPDQIMEELRRVQEQRFAVVDEELEMGLRSIAVPVRSPSGQVIAALNVGAPVSRRDVDWLIEAARPELQAAAAHLTRMM